MLELNIWRGIKLTSQFSMCLLHIIPFTEFWNTAW